jgi:geranylgeranyl pyrophosphate synthase
MMEHYGGMDYTLQKAGECVEKAKACLDIFPETKSREILKGFADYALLRNS